MKILVVPIDLSSVPGVSFPKETSLLRMYLSLIYPVLFSVHFQLDFLHSDHYSDYCSDFHLTSVFLHLAVVFLLAYLQPGNSQVDGLIIPLCSKNPSFSVSSISPAVFFRIISAVPCHSRSVSIAILSGLSLWCILPEGFHPSNLCFSQIHRFYTQFPISAPDIGYEIPFCILPPWILPLQIHS